MHDLLAQSGWSDAALPAQAMLLGWWNSVWPYLMMLFGFSVIVFVHELGHFAVAKSVGVRVEKFAIGFGRELFGFTRGETRYSFNLLPLGGFVKMLGQEDFDDKGNELKFKDDPRSFINKPVGKRMAIVSAGVIMNVLFAMILFAVIFMVGMKAMGTRVGFVEPDSPAHKAGLVAGDRILKINGENMLEFRDVSMAIVLAPPHTPIEFVVERNGKIPNPILVRPDYRRPENTRDARRQVIGILPGFTREIVWIGPAIDATQPNQPRVGDTIVEVDGVAVTDDNVNQMRDTLVYAKDIYVERKDPENPEAPAERIRVEIPPQLAIYPSDSLDKSTVNVLGFAPLMRFGVVDPSGRGYLAGINVGDTILSWDDVAHPTSADITRAIRYNAESDVPFTILKPDGRVVNGFVRPKRNRHGAGTVHALFETITKTDGADDGPKTRVAAVDPRGQAHRQGIEPGDVILECKGERYPTRREMRGLVRNNVGKGLKVFLKKSDSRIVTTILEPQVPGSIDASFTLVADDVLEVGNIVPRINGRASPAARAGIPSGARIVGVAGRDVKSWHEMIAIFRERAGTTIDLVYATGDRQERTTRFDVPHSLRTLLGVGPEARILSIDGKRIVTARTSRGLEEVHVGYHEGTRSLLSELVGRTGVPVEYRANALSPPQTTYLDVTEDMVDPWLGRIAFAPNVDVGPETLLLKGENAFDAVRIGLHKTYQFILTVYITMKRMIFSRTIGVETLSGPLGIVAVGGQMARAGLITFLYFLAIISANLAVINFLPMPIVDGGLMVFLLIEKIKGSPVSLRVQVATQMIGLFLIIGAFLFVTYNDALRILG